MAQKVEVFLTREEYKHALDVGYERSIKHRRPNGERLGTRFRTGRELPDISGDQLACVAEAAVAKYYGTKWNDNAWDLSNHSDMRRAPDVEPNFEVRRINRIDGQLSLRSDDEKNKVAVLVYVDYENSQKVLLLGAVNIGNAMEQAVLAEESTPSNHYVYFTQRESYTVFQDGLLDLSLFQPELTNTEGVN